MTFHQGVNMSTAPEATEKPSLAQKKAGEAKSLMADVRSEFGADGKDMAKKLASGNVKGAASTVDKVLDADPAAKGINIAQKAASRKAGDLAGKVGGKAGKAVAQDTTKIAAEAAKGASKGSAAAGIGAAPGAVLGATKGASQTKTGRWVLAIMLLPVIAYLAFVMILPLLFVTAMVDGGEQEEQSENVNDAEEEAEDIANRP